MKKKIVNALGIFLTLLSVAFIVRRSLAMNVEWGKLFTPMMLALFIVLPFTNVVVIFINSYCWRRSLTLFTNEKISNGDTFAIYTKCNLMKYLPSNIAHFAGRQLLGASLGIKQRHLALSSLLEIFYSIISMLLVSVLFSSKATLQFLSRQMESNADLLCVVIVLFAVLVVAIGVLLRHNKYIIEINCLIQSLHFWKTCIQIVLFFSVNTLLIGVSFVIIMGQYSSVDFSSMLLLISGSVASYFIGFVSPGVPGGIGVRESAMIMLLSPYFPSEAIILSAVAQRIISIAGDLLVFAISSLLKTGV